MGKKIKVAAIQIQYPDGEVKQISIDDARELYKQLDDLFGVEYAPPGQPIVIERDRYPRWAQWEDGSIRTDSPRPSMPQVFCCAETSSGPANIRDHELNESSR